MQVFAATPTQSNNGQVSNINQDSGQFSLQVNFNQQQSEQQLANQDPKVNIEELLNKLTKEQQGKFLSQFSQLNFAQQTYAYNQFLATPPEVQQFALNQFLSLDPQVLIVSIQTELNSEPSPGGQVQGAAPRLPGALGQAPQQFFSQTQPLRSSPLTQLDQNLFQTRFSSSNNPVLSQQSVSLGRPRNNLLQQSKNIPLTFFPQNSQG